MFIKPLREPGIPKGRLPGAPGSFPSREKMATARTKRVKVLKEASDNNHPSGIMVAQSQFDDRYNEIKRENRGLARIKHAMTCAQGDLDFAKLKDEDGHAIQDVSREELIDALTIIAKRDIQSLRDAPLSENEPNLFWNIIKHAGGCDAFRHHNNSASQLIQKVLLPDYDWAPLQGRMKRKRN